MSPMRQKTENAPRLRHKQKWEVQSAEERIVEIKEGVYVVMNADVKLKEAVELIEYLKSEAWGYEHLFETGFHADVHSKCEDFLDNLERETHE